MAERRALLLELAQVAGVTTSYVDGLGAHREVSDESLVAVLAALGHEISGPDGAPGALRAEIGRRDAELVPTCAVVWDGAELVVELRSSPSERADVIVEVATECGERHEYRHSLDVLGVCAEKSSGSVVVRHLLLGRFDDGYHSVTVRNGARAARCEVIAAPTVSYVIPELARSWGVFAPLYALHTSTGCRTGTLAELAAFAKWTKQRGGELVGTLPLLASYLDEPFDPSPYSPVSRLFCRRRDPRRRRAGAAR